MSNSELGIPEFAKPPVIETVLGVEFAPIDELGILAIGAFWDEIRHEYPLHQLMPPLQSIVDAEGATKPIQIQVQLLSAPEARIWMINKDGTRLVQLQRNRLLFNWRKVAGNIEYPRYASIRNLFASLWADFVAFLEDRGIDAPTILACEISYVNHLEIGREFARFEDVTRVFPFWGLRAGSFLPAPEVGGFHMSFPMPNEMGDLDVKLQPAIRNADLKNILQFELSAKGLVKKGKIKHAFRWLDVGHEWIVRGFTELTSPEMHAMWERSR